MSNDECETPAEFFDKLDKVFKFKLDAAASKQNAKCKRYFTKKDDALFKDWKCKGWVYLNPPYSKKAGGIISWLHQAAISRPDCRGIVCLVICDVSTASRHYVWHTASEIVELSPRINFASPGWKKRTGGFQSYQLVIFDRYKYRDRYMSRWNWKDEEFSERSNKILLESKPYDYSRK